MAHEFFTVAKEDVAQECTCFQNYSLLIRNTAQHNAHTVLAHKPACAVIMSLLQREPIILGGYVTIIMYLEANAF